MNLLATTYQRLLKPALFRFDPESVHDRFIFLGRFLGCHNLTQTVTAGLLKYSSPQLQQNILGIAFPNPIGLAAGFDKNAQLLDILPAVGFGFVEVGSITGEACAGNPKKRLWRLPQSQSLVVNYGLKNDGAEVIARRLRDQKFAIPVGVSVAKTNSAATVERQAGIADYVKAYRLLSEIGSYSTINISCPNAFGGQPFTDPESLALLLTAIDEVPTRKPVFVKFSPDLTKLQVDGLLAVIARHKVQGIICSNLTKNRNNERIRESDLPEKGGLSGKVVEPLADEMIAHVYRQTKGKYVIMGCGGVFTAEDAYKKIRLGASLIQLITGMVYQGPQLIGQINRGLVALLQRDGFTNISQAVGVDNKVS